MNSETSYNPIEENWTKFTRALDNMLLMMSGLELTMEETSPADWPEEDMCFGGLMVLASMRPSVLVIEATHETAANIISYMTGDEASQLSAAELLDGMCEMVNMVAGEAKSHVLDSADGFDLTSPIAVRGEQLGFTIKTGAISKRLYAVQEGVHLRMSYYPL